MIQRIIITGLLFILNMVPVVAQLQSPEQFLGYAVGSRFTPYGKVMEYIRHVSDQAPGVMKLQQYGTTYEGRPLVVCYISSPENIRELENIRLNNLRLANLSPDNNAPNLTGAPAIVWLSYNVHGNETSSTEAAMMTLYSLVDEKNERTKNWLRNTIVIIDPCINPDGRDRYVNWYNSIVGKSPDPKLAAREHREPWPGGRTNHYNFDLNRDWAWQTQVESRQRIKMYNQWMPHIHVDYHEQGINDPYYFAPAAQPFHEVITPWQREFQTTIGRNHAKYFDREGWLYFTREIFDLYYPSYGDTWPTYNGAIGMTYEQGGGPQGGLAVINDDGDTLRLMDRVMHHYTTSLSTIEVTSLNATKVVQEFRRFFHEAVLNGVGEFKSYVIRNKTGDSERIQAMLKLLTANGITYGYGSGTGKGYNYATGKEENFSFQKDVVISALQPRSAMVKVLFEPRPKLVDSLTYDITAWSLPYVYGLSAYASKERIKTEPVTNPAFKSNEPVSAYGYVIRWEGISTVKTVSQLLQSGIRLRFAEMPFESGGQSFDRGAVIILKNGNERKDLERIITETANANGVKVNPVNTGFVDKGYDFGSDKVRTLKAPRVLLVTGEGVSPNAAGEVWHFFEEEIVYPVTLSNANDLGQVRWSDWDVIIMPSGNYRFLAEKSSVDVLKDWVNKGGKLIAMGNVVNTLTKTDFGIKAKKEDDSKKEEEKDNYELLRRFEARERDFIPSGTPGALFKVDLDNTHPLAYGYPDHYYTLKLDDNIYEFFGAGAWNVGVLKKNSQVSGFVGSKLRGKLKDGLLFGVQPIGNGSVVYLADNVLFRNFWENGKLMFCNAVFLVGQ